MCVACSKSRENTVQKLLNDQITKLVEPWLNSALLIV